MYLAEFKRGGELNFEIFLIFLKMHNNALLIHLVN